MKSKSADLTNKIIKEGEEKSTPVSVTASPYENLTLSHYHEFDENEDEKSPTESQAGQKMRLECIQAAISMGISDRYGVIDTAQKFWDFIRAEE